MEFPFSYIDRYYFTNEEKKIMKEEEIKRLNYFVVKPFNIVFLKKKYPSWNMQLYPRLSFQYYLELSVVMLKVDQSMGQLSLIW